MLADKLMGSAGGKTYVDDVFSTYLYDGNSSTQTINNGIDLAGKGGMVWVKGRSIVDNHWLHDTTRGATKRSFSNLTNAEGTISHFGFTSSGFTQSGAVDENTSARIYVSWTFRNAPKFFTHTTKSHTTGTASTVDLSSLGTVGMVVAKITNTTGDWITWHRSLTASNNLRLNTTAAETTTNAWLSVSGTTATLSSAAPTGTYVIYAWAHDTASDGMIQCGSYTEGAANVEVSLGWEPQFIIIKPANQVSSWATFDSTRGFTTGSSTKIILQPNDTVSELTTTAYVAPTSTGFSALSGTYGLGTNVVYLAIRIPNKPPTTGTEVFQPVAYTGTNVDNRLVNTGIKTDMAWFRMRSGSGTGYEGFVVGDRLRGQGWLKTGSTQAETGTGDGLDQQIVSTTEYGTAFSSMTGVWVGNNTGTAASNVNINANTTANNHIVEAFKRAPGFMDVVCYTGTGSATTVPHQLGVAPELMIVKSRSSVNHWPVYCNPIGASNYLIFSLSDAVATNTNYWNGTAPTNSNFSVGTHSVTNGSGSSYVAYLFASLPGISKVGSYTGNGTSQTIDCGFSTGARFVMIKRTDSTGDWYVFDTARGITIADDPWIKPNSTVAENALTNYIAPASNGFSLETAGGSSTNISSATYIYLAIA